MNFVSIEFAGFLIITIILFYLFPKRFKQFQYVILILASYIFFCWNNLFYGVYLILATIVSYFGTFFIDKYKNRIKIKKFLLIASIALSVAPLLVLKYFNFINSTFSLLFSKPFNFVEFIIPVGISFYTFSIIAYIVDVYKGKVSCEKNILKLSLFISYFPKLLQGPICRMQELKDQLYEYKDINDIYFLPALKRIVIGLVKKILIADILGIFVDFVYADFKNFSGGILIITAILYSIQILMDFSGFMDIALGVSELFGINLPENFKTPYKSKSISEFWRNWHITLGTWLRDYIYIPLGGNRVSKIRIIFNILIVWLVSGLWHGAAMHYIVWGLYYFAIQSVNVILNPLYKTINKKLKLNEHEKVKAIFKIFTTFVFVTIGWVFFRSTGVKNSLSFLKRCLAFYDFTSFSNGKFDNFYISMWWMAVPLGALILISFKTYIKSFLHKIFYKTNNKTAKSILQYSSLLVICWICAGIYIYMKGLDVTQSGFIYFDF